VQVQQRAEFVELVARARRDEQAPVAARARQPV
jgi:hypothetical protein